MINMDDVEKKKFFNTLIERVEAHDIREKQSDGIIKKGVFKFPVFINGELCDTVMLTKKSTVETVVLLSREKVDGYISIDLDVDHFESKEDRAKKRS